jgi:hypothetical protein
MARGSYSARNAMTERPWEQVFARLQVVGVYVATLIRLACKQVFTQQLGGLAEESHSRSGTVLCDGPRIA